MDDAPIRVLLVEDDEEDFLRMAVGVLKPVDAGALYPVKGWQCRGCQFQRRCQGSA